LRGLVRRHRLRVQPRRPDLDAPGAEGCAGHEPRHPRQRRARFGCRHHGSRRGQGRHALQDAGVGPAAGRSAFRVEGRPVVERPCLVGADRRPLDDLLQSLPQGLGLQHPLRLARAQPRIQRVGRLSGRRGPRQPGELAAGGQSGPAGRALFLCVPRSPSWPEGDETLAVQLRCRGVRVADARGFLDHAGSGEQLCSLSAAAGRPARCRSRPCGGMCNWPTIRS